MRMMQPADPNGALMKAWNAYQATEEFMDSKRQATALYQSRQGGQADATIDVVREKEREQFVDGMLWATFLAGFQAAMKAWNVYQATEEFTNSKRWAMAALHRLRQEGQADATINAVGEKEREQYIDGSLWAAFMAGFKAAGGDAH